MFDKWAKMKQSTAEYRWQINTIWAKVWASYTTTFLKKEKSSDNKLIDKTVKF